MPIHVHDLRHGYESQSVSPFGCHARRYAARRQESIGAHDFFPKGQVELQHGLLNNQGDLLASLPRLIDAFPQVFDNEFVCL